MGELTTEDIAWIFEVAVLNFEGKPLSGLIGTANTQHIMLGKEVLELIKKKW